MWRQPLNRGVSDEKRAGIGKCGSRVFQENGTASAKVLR